MMLHALQQLALAAGLALGAGNAMAVGPSPSAGNGDVVATTSVPAVFHLGSAPAITTKSRRVLVGKIVGMEPPAQGAISVEVWLRSHPNSPPKLAGRFSPFPVVRIDPQSVGQHQPFLVPVQALVPLRGGGDWYVEFRLLLDSVSAGVSARLEFGGIEFSTD